MPHSQRQGASLCLIILLLLPLQMAGAEIITIDAATVDGIVPAIHGVTQGPIISSQSIREPPFRTCQTLYTENRNDKVHFPTLFVYRCHAEPASLTPQLQTRSEALYFAP